MEAAARLVTTSMQNATLASPAGAHVATMASKSVWQAARSALLVDSKLAMAPVRTAMATPTGAAQRVAVPIALLASFQCQITTIAWHAAHNARRAPVRVRAVSATMVTF